MSNIEPFKICRASAGSGKTFTVAMKSIGQMMLQHGKSTQAGMNVHRRLLAVTFTNDATAEMKSRILAELWTLVHNTAESKILQQLRDPKGLNRFNDWTNQEVADVANALITDILHDYGNLHIFTIDSFLQQLLRQLAHELGVGSRFNIELDADAAAAEATRGYLAMAETNDSVKGQLVKFLKQRLEDNKSWDIKADLTKFAKQMFNENFQSCRADLEQVDSSLYETVRKECSKQEAMVLDKMVKGATALKARLEAKEGVQNALVTFYGKVIATDKLVEWDDLLNATVKKSLADDGTLVKKNFTDDPQLLSDHKAFCQTLFETDLPTYYSLRATRAHLTELELLSELSNTLHQNLSEQGRFMLSDTAFLLSEIIGDGDAPFLFERLDAQIDNLFIDEAQDTSKLQWKIFRNFVKEKLSGGNFGMIVGDVKQSIYRWRNSDWRILNDIDNDTWLNLQTTNFDTLKNNFRSSRNVVNTNNELILHLRDHFARFFREHYAADATATAPTAIEKAYDEEKTCQQAKAATNGSVQYAFVSPDHSDIYAKAVVDKLLELREAGIRPHDIAILVRGHKSGNAIVSYAQQLQAEGFTGENERLRLLHEEGYLNFITDKAFELQNNRLLQLIVAALRLVKSPKEEIYRTMVLMLNKMVKGDGNYQLPVTAQQRNLDLPEQLQTRNLYILQSATLLDTVYTIVEALKLNTCKAHAAYLFTFLNEVQQFSDTNTATVANFLDYWDRVLSVKSLTSGASTNGVRITTIHKSKGLEFHTVIYPLVNESLNVDSGGQTASTNWFLPQDPGQKLGLFKGFPVLPIVTNKTIIHSGFNSQMRSEAEMSLMDVLNLTYVAVTRAKHNLVVIANYHKVEPKTDKKTKETRMVEDIRDERLADAIYTFAKDHATAGTDGHWSFVESDNDFAGKTFTLGALVPSEVQDNKANATEANATEANVTEANKSKPKTSPFESKGVEEHVLEFPLYSVPDSVKFVCSKRAKRFFQELSDNETKKHTLEAIERGLLLHSLYERIATVDDIDHAVHALLVEGQIATQAEADALAQEVRTNLEKETISDWFSPKWTLYNESGMITLDQDGKVEERRPDRVMTYGKDTIVVDYKFGERNAHHHRQVADYMNFLQKMGFPNVKGYLWYVTLNQIEEVKPQ